LQPFVQHINTQTANRVRRSTLTMHTVLDNGFRLRKARFQHASSWARQICPETLAFTRLLEVETEMSADGLLVSGFPRVGNGSLAPRRLHFQLDSSRTSKHFWATLPVQTRGKLETGNSAADISFSSTHCVGNASVSGQRCCFQPGASWERPARPRTSVFPKQVL
jgi:hypothetical protein